MFPFQRSTLFAVLAVSTVPVLLSAQEPNLPPDLKKVTVADGVELHYLEKGKGDAIVFVHGGGGDYSSAENQLDPLAGQYRAITYSRAYCYPNTNEFQPKYSFEIEAEYLATLMKKLDVKNAHIVGSSIGGNISLCLAIQHPELVRTLTLAEAPVRFKGDPVNENPQRQKAIRAAFEKGKPEEALRMIFEFGKDGKQTWDKFTPEFQKLHLRNARSWEAGFRYDMWTLIDREAVKKLAIPTLFMTGQLSEDRYQKIMAEMTRLIPEAKRQTVVIPGAGHPMWYTHPEPCRKALLEFLKDKARPAAAGDKDKKPAATRPVISEEVAPLDAIAPVAKDGHKGICFLRKPPGKGPFPAVVLLHGGFGGIPADRVKKVALDTWASRYLEAGYVVATITYRKRDADPQSAEAVADVIAVIEQLRKLPQVDPKSIVVNGTSGGGDLALSVAAATDLAAIVPEEPAAFMFTGILNKQFPKKGDVFTVADAEPIRADPKKYYTPECQRLTREKIGRIKCPILLIQGDLPTIDAPNMKSIFTGVYQFNKEITIRELRAAGKTVEVKTYPGEPHSFAFGNPFTQSPRPAVAAKAFEDVNAFLKKQLQTRPTPMDPKLVKQVPFEVK